MKLLLDEIVVDEIVRHSKWCTEAEALPVVDFQEIVKKFRINNDDLNQTLGECDPGRWCETDGRRAGRHSSYVGDSAGVRRGRAVGCTRTRAVHAGDAAQDTWRARLRRDQAGEHPGGRGRCRVLHLLQRGDG